MKQKIINVVLILTAVVIFLLVVLVYMQSITIEHFSEINLESSRKGNWNNMNMTHNTALDPEDIIDPTLNNNDIVYQSTKYQALMNNGFNKSSPISSPVPSTTSKEVKFAPKFSPMNT